MFAFCSSSTSSFILTHINCYQEVCWVIIRVKIFAKKYTVSYLEKFYRSLAEFFDRVIEEYMLMLESF